MDTVELRKVLVQLDEVCGELSSRLAVAREVAYAIRAMIDRQNAAIEYEKVLDRARKVLAQ